MLKKTDRDAIQAKHPSPRSLGGLPRANDRAGAAFTVDPVPEMAIAYAWSVYARRPMMEKYKVQAATVEREGRLKD